MGQARMADVPGYSGITASGAGFSGVAPSVGYSGITADGQGFTGWVPLGESTSGAASATVIAPYVGGAGEDTKPGYEDALAAPLDPSSLAKEFGYLSVPTGTGGGVVPSYEGITAPSSEVLERSQQIARLRTQAARGDVPTYSEGNLFGYSYVRDEALAPGGDAGAALGMAALQDAPNDFFPFDVLTTDGKPGAIRKGELLLLRWRPGTFAKSVSPPFLPFLPPGDHPVRVVDVTPNSFTFSTEGEHFDPPGSMISFVTTADAAGLVHLVHIGATAPGGPSPLYLTAPAIAEEVWSIQSNALRQWLLSR
jgi:hypothetical protein